MNFLNEHFKIIVVVLNSLIFMLVLSIRLTTCTLANDMRTTKKTTKFLNEKSITTEDLDQKLEQQTQQYLVKEKQLDGVKDTSIINKILNKQDTLTKK